jgi:predicted phage terminase large subunit-like protein
VAPLRAGLEKPQQKRVRKISLMMKSSDICAEKRLRQSIRESLTEFATYVLAPMKQVPAAHHRLLMSALDDVDKGTCDRLMVLMPPGSAKSTYASVIFPAWWLSRHPQSSVIACAHTASLAEHFGRRVRDLAAEAGLRLGYMLARDARSARNWRTSAGGSYFATGVRGPVTGRRADLLLIDDPVKSHQQADSALSRQLVWDWYRSDLTTRLKPGGRIVLIMTRWHVDDLGGRVLSDKSWRVLRLPALAETDDPLGRAVGDPLWPEWEDGAALARTRTVLGERDWAALFQQSPLPVTGMLFRTTGIETIEAQPVASQSVRAWDLAASVAVDGRDPDWTVGVKLLREPTGRFVVADVVRLRGGPHEVEQAIVNTARTDGRVTVALPQDPGQAGRAQMLYLTRKLAGHHVVATPESGAKLTRALPVAAQVDAGNVAMVRGEWNKAFLDELREFPHGAKDDQVDALSRAFATMIADNAPLRAAHVPYMGR